MKRIPRSVAEPIGISAGIVTWIWLMAYGLHLMPEDFRWWCIPAVVTLILSATFAGLAVAAAIISFTVTKRDEP